MFKILLLLALGSAVNCLQLQYLCPSDHFDYEDVRVNAIYRANLTTRIETVSYFNIIEDCSGYRFTYSERDAAKLKAEL